jgi:hypothetical protein
MAAIFMLKIKNFLTPSKSAMNCLGISGIEFDNTLSSVVSKLTVCLSLLRIIQWCSKEEISGYTPHRNFSNKILKNIGQ